MRSTVLTDEHDAGGHADWELCRQQHAVSFTEQAESPCINFIYVLLLIETVHKSYLCCSQTAVHCHAG